MLHQLSRVLAAQLSALFLAWISPSPTINPTSCLGLLALESDICPASRSAGSDASELNAHWLADCLAPHLGSPAVCGYGRGRFGVEGAVYCSCKVHENVAHSRAWTACIPHMQCVEKGEVDTLIIPVKRLTCSSDGGQCGRRLSGGPYLEAAEQRWHLSAASASGRVASGFEVTTNPIHSNAPPPRPFFSG